MAGTKKRLGELANEISSKNAGNYFLTFDIVFDDEATYHKVKRSGVLTRDLVAQLYSIPLAQITHFVAFDQGSAIKITIRRPWISGAIGESDVFGAQQYAPLLDVEIPWDDE